MSIESAVRKGIRRALREDEELSDVDVEEGKMHELLDVPQDQKISDEYDSGEELARDLVDATGDEKEASGMIAYAANINPEDNIFDDALDAIDEIDFEEQQTKNQPMIREAIREAIREVLTEDDSPYQEFVREVMDMLGIDSPQDLTEDGREEFFTFIDRKWDSSSDEAEEVTEEDLASDFEPDYFKDSAPDFITQKEEIRKKAKNALREAIIRMKS
jgi:hypothetical protein